MPFFSNSQLAWSYWKKSYLCKEFLVSSWHYILYAMQVAFDVRGTPTVGSPNDWLKTFGNICTEQAQLLSHHCSLNNATQNYWYYFYIVVGMVNNLDHVERYRLYRHIMYANIAPFIWNLSTYRIWNLRPDFCEYWRLTVYHLITGRA